MSRLTPEKIKAALDRCLDEAMEDFRYLTGASPKSIDDDIVEDDLGIAEILFPEALKEESQNEYKHMAREIDIFLEEPIAALIRKNRSCQKLCQRVLELQSDLLQREKRKLSSL